MKKVVIFIIILSINSFGVELLYNEMTVKNEVPIYFDTSKKIVKGMAKEGEKILILGESGDGLLYKIKTENGKEGYISKEVADRKETVKSNGIFTALREINVYFGKECKEAMGTTKINEEFEITEIYNDKRGKIFKTKEELYLMPAEGEYRYQILLESGE